MNIFLLIINFKYELPQLCTRPYDMMNIGGSYTEIMTVLVRKRIFETRCDGTDVLKESDGLISV